MRLVLWCDVSSVSSDTIVFFYRRSRRSHRSHLELVCGQGSAEGRLGQGFAAKRRNVLVGQQPAEGRLGQDPAEGRTLLDFQVGQPRLKVGKLHDSSWSARFTCELVSSDRERELYRA